MADIRWMTPAAPAPQSTGPAVGKFRRNGRAGEMVISEAPITAAAMRVLGSDPDEACNPALQRSRNGANRSVYVVHQGRATRRNATTLRVPVIGEIAAGHYDVTVAFHDYLEYERGVEVERVLVRAGSGAYALRVRGTSMSHVGIAPGDLVVVQPQDSADNGDFVVARLSDSTDPEGYVTLKRFYRKQDHIFLQSATAEQDPIRLFPNRPDPTRPDRDRVKIQGRVVVIIKNSAE